MLMETSSPDRAKLETLSKTVTDLRGQIQSKSIDYQLAAKKIAPELNMGGQGFGNKHGYGKTNYGNCPHATGGNNQ